jgi:hypothetical protein
VELDSTLPILKGLLIMTAYYIGLDGEFHLRELSADKTVAVGGGQALQTMSRVELCFPPVARNVIKRTLSVAYMGINRPATKDFTPDDSAVEILVPSNEVIQVELQDIVLVKMNSAAKLSLYTHPRARNQPFESSAIAYRLLGETSVGK